MFTYSGPEQKPKDTVEKKESEKIATPNLTGIPNTMKARFENLSGFSFDDVRVHYNSDKPVKLQALAYTQGNQVYVAPGQEKHLRHELGHVVQQRKGIVSPTMTIGGVPVNDSESLETEADRMGLQDHQRYDNRKIGAASSKTIQRIRKCVQEVDKDDVSKNMFYDKSDGKYYSGMKYARKQKTEPTDVMKEDSEMLNSYKEEGKSVSGAEPKSRSENTYILAELKNPQPPSKREFAYTKKGKLSPVIYDNGHEIESAPNTIRLYAEGDMRHAISIAKGINSSPEKYGAFKGLEGDLRRVSAVSNSLIKATEYEGKQKLAARYGKPKIAGIEEQRPSNLEVSFGGKTGDMARQSSGNSKRKYDIVQATFFWIPEMKSSDNAKRLIDFAANQYKKLKDGGVIRIVLINQNKIEFKNREKREKLSPEELVEQFNNYRAAADYVVNHFIEKDSEKYIVELIPLGKTYADTLHEEGLNAEESFQHTETSSSKKVETDHGDLTIKLTRRPDLTPQDNDEKRVSDAIIAHALGSGWTQADLTHALMNWKRYAYLMLE